MKFLKKFFKWVKNNSISFLLFVLAVLIIASPFLEYHFSYFFPDEVFLSLWTDGEEWTGAATRNFLFALGGVAALYGLVVARRRLDIQQKTQITESTSRAIENLSHKDVAIRMAGVSMLERIAIENKNELEWIYRILKDFVDERATSDDEMPDPEEIKPSKDRADILLAIKALGRIFSDEERKDKRLNFSKLDLRGLSFRRAKFQNAYFYSAKLQGTIFDYTNLQGANFTNAELKNAGFNQANLQGANFTNAELEDTCFTEGRLQGANFMNAKLQYALFDSANLQGTVFRDAKLENAIFVHAQLQGADFSDANLEKADFSAVSLFCVENLNQNQMEQIVYQEDCPPRNLPDGITLDESRAYRFEHEEPVWVRGPDKGKVIF